jgi:HAMP domain-containing protein/signal transduction histidine kinase/ActR/RegA family two-component response regulator
MLTNESIAKRDAKRRYNRKPSASSDGKQGADKAKPQLRALCSALKAAVDGDFSVCLPSNGSGGLMHDIVRNFNQLVGLNGAMTAEITRVEQAVRREGRMTEIALLPNAAGSWLRISDSINALINGLVQPSTEVARVISAVAEGDLTQKMALEIEGLPVKGEFLRIGTTVNAMVDQLSSFAAEVTRVAREVGTDGKLGGQAQVKGVSGIWKDLTDNVNVLARNLTDQVRNIAKVTTAVANGDLSQKITVDVKGEVLELKNTINTMVDQLNSFAAEVARVAREVGTEGKLGGQAVVKGVSGVWKDLTDNVNFMASNLTTQVRGIVRVVTAVANGDLSPKLEVAAKGEIAALADTLNSMTKTLATFAEQVTSVARTVGVQGKLGAQAQVPNAAGTWKDLTDNVNLLANNLTVQVRNIAEVTTAVAKGDLSKKITVNAEGEVNELKNTINTMVDQLRSFAAEVTRVAREVGTEGRLGGQALVPGVSGTWKDLTDNVNSMASNLTGQVRNIAQVTTAVANGDLSKKITVDVKGEILELKNTINTMVDQLNSFASEVTRVAREVGTEGELGGQAVVQGVSGVWKDLTDNVNFMARNLTAQVRGIVKVVTAVANGDLKQKLAVDARGEIAALAETINNMTDTLSTFAEQVNTVAREVGVEGKLGGQAQVPGVAGTWKDLTDNVNFMASNLTTQVRGIVKVVTAVANGDLSQKLIGVEAKGEIAALADTINSMTDTLRIFAEQVSTVAREVGIEGKLGGQAKVPGASGTWRGLTDNVNQLAGNLTNQVRAISEVSQAVTKGDLTRSIKIEAAGEVAALSDTINQMIVNLRETTQKNMEQDWLKTNLARFSSMMQGQRDLDTVSRLIMSELTPLVGAHYGAFFLMEGEGDDRTLKLANTYAYRERKGIPNRFKLGESLVGQCALEKKTILVIKVPSDYITISSGLGEATPLNIIVLPILFEDEIRAVIELASFQPFSTIHQLFLDQLSESIGVVLNVITANMRTGELLAQSQKLAQELQNQSTELTEQQQALRTTNAALERQALELEEKANLLEEQNAKVEEKNREVEQARRSLEEKAEQLAMVSKYKSDFLANMSHELRTPLNSLLVLAKVLSENKDGDLSDRQLEYARTICTSGTDLLRLINEVLDLSKLEAGKFQVELRDFEIAEIGDLLEKNFRPLAEEKALDFFIEMAPDVPRMMQTDRQRLEQILRNLLANALKFTETGWVKLKIDLVRSPLAIDDDVLREAENVITFSVIDTGIGIAKDKQKIIFEAFQQADGGTSRKYGGTGLGLSISREIARALKGTIEVSSTPGGGSSFTLYLPLQYALMQWTDDHRDIPADAYVSPAGSNTRMEMNGRPLRRVDGTTNGADRADSQLAELSGKTVLIVDDDMRNIFATRVLLESYGMTVLEADNGIDAIALVEGHPELALVLMDIMMPEMDGYETIERLRTSAQHRALPVIAVTAKAFKEDREQCIEAGACDYIVKPINENELIDIIRLWLSGTHRPQVGESPQ